MKKRLILLLPLLALGSFGCNEAAETTEPDVGTVLTHGVVTPDVYCCCTDGEHNVGCEWRYTSCDSTMPEASDPTACGPHPYDPKTP